jgi:hypothetical protein
MGAKTRNTTDVGVYMHGGSVAEYQSMYAGCGVQLDDDERPLRALRKKRERVPTLCT